MYEYNIHEVFGGFVVQREIQRSRTKSPSSDGNLAPRSRSLPAASPVPWQAAAKKNSMQHKRSIILRSVVLAGVSKKNAADVKYEALPGIPVPIPRGFWTDKANRRLFCDSLEQKLKLASKSDWYYVSRNYWIKYGGGSLLRHQYSSSIANALLDVYPEHNWLAWKFSKVPVGYWDSLDNQRKFLEWIILELGLPDATHLKSVSTTVIQNQGGGGLLSIYKDSMQQLLRKTFPDIAWDAVQILDKSLPPIDVVMPSAKPHDPVQSRHSPGFWLSVANQKAFMDSVYSKLGLRSLDDWYSTPLSKVSELGPVHWIYHYYGASLSRALAACYPEHQWLQWRFSQVEPGYWSHASNRKKFVEWMAKELSITSMDMWYNINRAQFSKLGAYRASRLFGNSPARLLQSVFPDHNWELWRFPRSVGGVWEDAASQREFCDWMMREMNLSKPEDWYGVTTKDFITHGGIGMLEKYYGKSVLNAVMALYPEYKWRAWEFKRLPANYWKAAIARKDLSQITELVDHLNAKLSIANESDWYRISLKDPDVLPLRKVVEAFGSIYGLLSTVYPTHKWEVSKFLRQKKSKQRKLKTRVAELFPNEEIFEEMTTSLPQSLQQFRFDLFLPRLNLMLEYDGEQHYADVSNAGQHSVARDSDRDKAAMCAKEGITLLSIPYWWDTSLHSLGNTIRAVRPELVPDTIKVGPPIPHEKPVTTKSQPANS